VIFSFFFFLPQHSLSLCASVLPTPVFFLEEPQKSLFSWTAVLNDWTLAHGAGKKKILGLCRVSVGCSLAHATFCVGSGSHAG